MSDKNPGGRPTKYNDEMVKKARYYLENFEAIGDQIPSIAGLSIYLGMSRTYLYEWRKDVKKEEFSDILEKIITMQENVLINKGLSGDFNSNITKLVLGKHGYHEKQDHEHTGSITNPHQGTSRTLEILGEFQRSLSAPGGHESGSFQNGSELEQP